MWVCGGVPGTGPWDPLPAAGPCTPWETLHRPSGLCLGPSLSFSVNEAAALPGLHWRHNGGDLGVPTEAGTPLGPHCYLSGKILKYGIEL